MSSAEIAAWLVETCGVSQRKAIEVADRFNNELWISEVDALKNCLECNPRFLERCQIPLTLQMAIKAQVFVQLEDLTVDDVKRMLEIAFKEEPMYGLRYHAAKINGTVLSHVKHHKDLHDWGLDNMIHAEAFFRRIELWKQEGVAKTILQKSSSVTSSKGSTSSATTEPASAFNTGFSSKKPETASKEVAVVGSGDDGEDSAVESKTSQAKTTFKASSDIKKDGTSSRAPGKKEREEHEEDGEEREDGEADEDTSKDGGDSPQDRSTNRSVDSSTRSPRKRVKVQIPTDPGERMSPRNKVPCQVFDPVPVKRAEKQQARQELALADAARAAKLAKKPGAGRPSMPPRRVAVGAAALEAGPSGAMVQIVQQMESDKVAVQVKALNALHKMVAEDARAVVVMRSGGAVDKLLDMLALPEEYDVSVLVAVLDVVNTIIALSRDTNVEYLMEQGLIPLVQPMCMSSIARIRLLAVWILGNVGTVFFKELIIRPAVVATLLESYNSSSTFKGREQAEVRDRFAETMKQLCSGSVANQFHTLTKLLPIMVDIITKEDRVEPVASACEALNHLIDSNGSNAVDTFVATDVIGALIGRLDASRAMIVFSALRALAFVAACSNEEQIKALDPAMARLQDLVLGSSSDAPSHKVFAQAGLFVSMLCKHGERPIQLIMDQSPGVFQQFFDILNLRTALQVKQGKVNAKAQNAALALMYASQRGSNAQLAYFLGQGLYTLCFRVLFTFDDIPNLLVQTLKALRRLVVKVENIAEVQRGESDFDADKAWAKVRALMHTNKSGHMRLQDVVADSDSGMENDSQSTTDAKVRKYAGRLHEAAVVQRLLPA